MTTPLHQRVTALRDLVEEILTQFRLLHASTANGPHVELSVQELRLVEFLGDTGPRITRELAEHLLVAVNSVTNTVDNLEQKGTVRRQRSLQDRRVIRVELTDDGKHIYKAAVADKQQLLKKMLTALTDDEQEIFMVLFRKIARAGWSKVQRRSS